MGKKRFFTKMLIIGLGSLLICGGILYARYAKYPLSTLAFVHVSNSISYNSNIQHLVATTDVDSIRCLVMGSSVSLNNLSAKIIEDSIGLKTYNLGSWGFPLHQTINFFSIVHFKNCNKVIMAFNNVIFLVNYSVRYDFLQSKYYLQGNKFVKLLVVLKAFNFLQFDMDTKYKDSSVKISALEFDAHGSLLLDRKRYKQHVNIPPLYNDTAGFSAFFQQLIKLKEMLAKDSCQLTLVYAPFKNKTFNKAQMNNNDSVAARLKAEFPDNFIDLHHEQIPDSLYVDEVHLYKEGAELLTKQMLAAMKKAKDD